MGARKSSGNKRKNKRLTTPREPWATPLNGLLSLIIVLGSAYLFMPESKTIEPDGADTTTQLPPFPAAIPAKSDDGADMARFDDERVAAWCRSADLPVPPALGMLDKSVAENLNGAYRAVIQRRNDQTLGKLGMLYEALDCHETAVSYFQRAGKRNPREFNWPYYLGCIHQLVGEDDLARQALLAAEERKADYPVLHARLGQIALENGDWNEAERRFSRYVNLQPDDSLGYVGLGRVALARKDYGAARQQLQTAVAKGPGDFQAHFYLAETLAATGDKSSAQVLYDKAASLPQGKWFFLRDPLDQALHQTTGSLQSLITRFEQLNSAGRYSEMEDIAGKILRQRPRDTMMWTNLANVYLKQKRFDEAHDALDKAEAVQPGLAQTLLVRAAVFLGQSRWQEASDVASRACKLRSASAEAHTIHGRAEFMLRNFPEAEAALARALQLNGNDAGNHYIYGEVLLGLDRRDDARQAFRKAVERNPNLVQAKQRLDELRP